MRRRRGCKGPRHKIVGAFLNLDAAAHRQVFEGLTEATGPANGGANRALDISDSKEKLLGVLRQESGTGLEVLGLTMSSGLDCHRSTDCIAIAVLSTEAE